MADNPLVGTFVMIRKLPLLIAMLAWCCLAVPWQSCDSDCRNGALQPLGHGCHTEAAAASKLECHCGHGDGQAVAADDFDDADAAGPERAHRCEDGEHTNVVFQQTEPDRSIEVDDDPVDPWIRPPAIAIPSFRRWAHEVVSPVDPPGREPQRLRQLRVDVLLI